MPATLHNPKWNRKRETEKKKCGGKDWRKLRKGVAIGMLHEVASDVPPDIQISEQLHFLRWSYTTPDIGSVTYLI